MLSWVLNLDFAGSPTPPGEVIAAVCFLLTMRQQTRTLGTRTQVATVQTRRQTVTLVGARPGPVRCRNEACIWQRMSSTRIALAGSPS